MAPKDKKIREVVKRLKNAAILLYEMRQKRIF